MNDEQKRKILLALLDGIQKGLISMEQAEFIFASNPEILELLKMEAIDINFYKL